MSDQIGRNEITYLYKLYDASGAKLYVGISTNVQRRMGEHRSSKVWFDRVARIEIEEFTTRWRAALAELAAGRGRHGQVPGGIGKKMAASMTDDELREAAAHPVYEHWSDGTLARQWGFAVQRIRDLRTSPHRNAA